MSSQCHTVQDLQNQECPVSLKIIQCSLRKTYTVLIPLSLVVYCFLRQIIGEDFLRNKSFIT